MMDHPNRLIPLLSAFCLAAIPSTAEETPLGAVIQWTGQDSSPAVSTDHPTWLLGVAPDHVEIGEGSSIQVSHGEELLDAKVLHHDESNGLSLIEVERSIEGLKIASLATNSTPVAGAKLSCWKPGNSCPTAVAGKEYSVRGEPLSAPLLKVHVADAKEFCDPGTPLICGKGKLFGILTEVVSTETGEAHAIPASCLHKLLTEYERFQHSGKVWVGLVFEDQAQTPTVVEVRSDSPAEKAGLRPGDVILGVGEHEMSDLDDLTQTIHLLIAGDPVEVTVLRGLEEMKLELIPEFAGKPALVNEKG